MAEPRDLRELARIRSGRDADRPTEDDLAKKSLGEQGHPNKGPKPQQIGDDELQNPKSIDPGHTA